MVFTFLNVTVFVEADSGVEAYTKLCNALSNESKLEWLTDRFVTEDNETERSTTEIMHNIP